MGNTGKGKRCFLYRRDHPRIRGEHALAILRVTAPLGSSPHSRGTRYSRRYFWRRGGIIPAFAGNTRRWYRSQGRTRDHPRIRGEHMTSMSHLRYARGSSPHSRGTLFIVGDRLFPLGIIPAFAGNTQLAYWSQHLSEDHPRIRGEHFPAFRCWLHLCGIISAFAGNTAQSS